jgi:hypothetical protein
MPGGGRAGLAAHVVWKVPTLPSNRDLQKTVDLQNQCVAKQKIYYNKATRLAFLAVADPLYISSKSALLASVTYFTGEFNIAVSIPSDRTIANQGPQFAAQLALLTQNEDIALDLRYLNGRPTSTGFDFYWAKAEFLLEEFKKVDDRRHGAFIPFLADCLMTILHVNNYMNCGNIANYICIVMHVDSESGALFLPFAISTRDLLEKVKEALIEDHPEGLEEANIKIPSLSWLEYQFAPANLGHAGGLRNTGMTHLISKGINSEDSRVTPLYGCR